MIFELEPIFNNVGVELPVAYTMDLSDVPLNGVFPFKEPVSVRGEFRNRAGIVSVCVRVQFVLDMFCDRCAQPMRQSFDMQVEHVLVRELADESNDELILLESFRMDLDELVSDDIFLSLPTKFLCKDDCLGVCPTCGQNLNDGPCSCKKSVDPRLAGLLQLLEDS
jgi:uncharacterized protein